MPHKTIASNKATKKARQAHFSKLIQDNKNNPTVLSDFFINPGFNHRIDENLQPTSKMRDVILPNFSHPHLSSSNCLPLNEERLEMLVLVNTEMLDCVDC